ncbi:MAG: SGNH/GDSL hydrolase family protein [Planctomycetota bacterium]
MNPAFLDPEIDPDLPNVLLIGDSISIGYTLHVRKALSGRANVFRPKTNCGPTTRGLEQMESWLTGRDWAAIHFNFGLHDLKYLGPQGQNLANPADPNSRQQVPPDAYRENLARIAKQVKATGAVVIWRETSPVPVGAKGRVPGDAAKYNAIARDVMLELGGIEIDPFFDFATKHAKLQRDANVHYLPEGQQTLGSHVAEVIESALLGKPSVSP